MGPEMSETMTEHELVRWLISAGETKGWRASGAPASYAWLVFAERTRDGIRERLGITRIPGGWRVEVRTSGPGSPIGRADVEFSDERLRLDGIQAVCEHVIRWLP